MNVKEFVFIGMNGILGDDITRFCVLLGEMAFKMKVMGMAVLNHSFKIYPIFEKF